MIDPSPASLDRMFQALADPARRRVLSGSLG